jgi:hypothetical protein
MYTSIVDGMAKPYLKPEHAKWLHDNYYHPDTEGIAQTAANAAKEDPKATAAHKDVEAALSAAKDNPDYDSASAKVRAASAIWDEHFGKALAKHFGTHLDNYIAGTAERELKARVDRATAAGNAAPITQKPNGKYVAGCMKCGGSGVIPRHSDVEDGKCFDCNGRGYSHNSTEYSSREEARTAMIEGRVAQAKQPTQPRPEPARETPATPAPKPKGFANKYAGKCVGCGTKVGVGEGITSKGMGGWEVRCVGCHHG